MDVVVFFYCVQFLLYFQEGVTTTLLRLLYKLAPEVFSCTVVVPNRVIIMGFIFLFLLVLNFFGYFPYSFSFTGLPEFTAVFAFVSWFSTFLLFISREKFSIYLTGGGYNYLKRMFILLIEFLREFRRPFSLTVRLVVNIMIGHIFVGLVYSLFFFLGTHYL